MEKITYRELTELFIKQEANGKHTTGYIVFTEDSFSKPYPLEARTYVVSSDNKAYQSGKGGYSIFGSSLDGSDTCVRLDRYMLLEKGGKNGWKVDYCYIKEDNEA